MIIKYLNNIAEIERYPDIKRQIRKKRIKKINK